MINKTTSSVPQPSRRLMLKSAICTSFIISSGLGLFSTKTIAASQYASVDPENKNFIPLEGAFNFRNLGGITGIGNKIIKTGLIYRSDELNALTETDLEKLRKLNIKTIVDFRNIVARNKKPDKSPSSTELIVMLPIDDSPFTKDMKQRTEAENRTAMQELNKFLVRQAIPQYKKFFSILEKPEMLPLVFHCTAGKDRTGYAAYLILSALGAKQEDILKDFTLSAKYVQPKFAKFAVESPHIKPILTVEENFLQSAISVINTEYGGVEKYLTDNLGVNLNAFRNLYLA